MGLSHLSRYIEVCIVKPCRSRKKRKPILNIVLCIATVLAITHLIT